MGDRLRIRKRIICTCLALAVASCVMLSVYASATDNWNSKWDEAVSDRSVISLSPGADSTQMCFAWLERIGQKSAFRCGATENLTEADAVEVRESFTLTGQKRCSVTVCGLLPDSTYYYMYFRNGAWSETYMFHTAGRMLTALFVSDAQLGRSGDWRDKNVLLHDVAGWDTALTEAVLHNPEISLCLSAGDQAEIGASEQQYRLFLAPQTLRSLPIATTIGNHEFYFPYLNLHFAHPNRIGSGAVHSLGDEPYYFTQQNVLFIVLDSNDPFSLDHEAVLERAVQAYSDARWRVVMMHHSLFSCENTPEDGPRLRKTLAPLFQKYGVDLVLSGHTHRYSRSVPIDGITYLEGGCCSGCNCHASPDVLPSYTAAGYPQKNPVYSVLRFGEDTITIQSYAVENGESVLIDEGAVEAGGEKPAGVPRMATWAKAVQAILSLFSRAVSLLFV